MMKRELSTSEFLITQIESRDDAFTPEERAQAEKDRAFTEAVARNIIKARTDRVDKSLAALEVLVRDSEGHELIAGTLNNFYTREALDAIPSQVDRTLRLAKLEIQITPSAVTNSYLREAIRTYILGLPQASVALSRAALEQALKEGMGYQSTKTIVEMKGLLDEAESGIGLDRSVRKLAEEVAKAGNDVLHEKPTTLEDAFNVLIKMRGVFESIYADQ
ncbi:DUF4145 domain-containing protein [Silvibacterium dinghuense]|nr:DUF4145 domain-containing protein [Silvibacterium dinghuense]